MKLLHFLTKHKSDIKTASASGPIDLYETLFKHLPELVYILDLHGNLIEANEAFTKALGYADDEIQRPFVNIIALEQFDIFHHHYSKLLKGGVQQFNLTFTHKEGRLIDFNHTMFPIVCDGRIVVIYGIAREVAERKRSEISAIHRAIYDPLTGLATRDTFIEKLEQTLSIAKTRKVAVMQLDMDRFKFINDSLGYSTGDRLLMLIAERLRQCTEIEHTVARLGGDEFAILFPDIQKDEDVSKVAQNIIHQIEEPFLIDGAELYLTTSIGISMYPNDGDDAKALIKNADTALSYAKENGKHTYRLFTPTMNAQAYKNSTLYWDLHKAIEQNELELYYQPKVQTMTGRIVGAEAFIRWNHPKWGIIYPDDFLFLAEESGVITSIGKWVNQTVCAQNKKWIESGLPPIPIAINLSAKRFLHQNLCHMVRTILEESKLDPHLFEIEITEESFIENEEVVLSALDELRRIGVKIALDDFGTGYSSLSYLKRFRTRIDTLKIDKLFIDDLHQDSDDIALIKSIIQLAQQMNLTVVAEGVETIEQFQVLKQLKCEQIQGYLFSKPIPARHFAELLKKEYIEPDLDNAPPVPMINQREYFRIELEFPLSSTMTIANIHGKDVEVGRTEVLIEDIGIGGLRFLSALKMGVHPEAILQFETLILGEKIKLFGSIVWFKEIEAGIFQYGLQFTDQVKDDSSIIRLLNQFSIQLRKSALFSDCSFVKDDKYRYLQTH